MEKNLKSYTIGALCFSLFIASGCVSQKSAEPDTSVSEADFIQKGYTYLAQPAEDGFFSYINIYGGTSASGTKMLLDSYAKKQRELIDYYREKKNYPRVRFFYNNLLPVDNGSAQEARAFAAQLLQYYKAKKQYALEKSLKIKEGILLSDSDFHPLADIQDFRRLLAEVYVERTYESADKLLRTDDPRAMGSGILISRNHVLTAYHVIEHVFYENTKSYSIEVKVQDRTIKDAKVLSWDSLSDLAVIKLPESADMPFSYHAIFGNSESLVPGFEVYCFGHHEGYTSTLTRGIVSATSRRAPELGTWLQIDAALAPGASGGMLIGKDNLIYGVLVAGILYEDINFVVPSNAVLRVIDQLIAGETVRRPWLGLLLEETQDQTVSVIYKFPSSPLKGYNVAESDVIKSINGISIATVEDAQKILYELETGNLVKLSLKDSFGNEKEVYTLLSNRPDFALLTALRYNDRISTYYPYFGFELDTKSQRKLSLTVGGRTVQIPFYRIIRVRKASFLDHMGVKENDYLGLVADQFQGETRVIEVIHMPVSVPANKFAEHLYDYIFDLRKVKYENNIL